MKNAMRCLFYIVLYLLCAGCAYSVENTAALDEVEAMMDCEPATALERLNALDVSQFGDSASVARFALLYSEAMVANGLSAPADTIICVAESYYTDADSCEAQRLQCIRMRMCGDISTASDLANALYRQKEREIDLYCERTRRNSYVAGGIFLLLLAGSVIGRQRQRMRFQNLRNEALMAEASGLRGAITAKDADLSDLRDRLHGMLDSRFAFIDGLCETYYESQGTKRERKAVAERVKCEIESLKDDGQMFAEMERLVNNCRDGMLERLKSAYPSIRETDYRLAVYLACGLSNRTISLLTGVTVENVYQRKSRLRKRITDHISDYRHDDFRVLL